MVTFEDEQENGTGSPDNSSENDADEAMDDADDAEGEGDVDQDGDQEGDVDAEGDNDDEEGDNDDEDDQEDTFAESPSRRRTIANGTDRHERPGSTGGASSGPNPTVSFTSPSPRASSMVPGTMPFRPSVRPDAITATSYDIIPTMAAPHSTSINVVTATPDMRWVFSGGTDGYIRKFNWVDTANGKLPLTVAQRHPFVDSVTKAGVLVSYWENEEYSPRTPPNPSSTESASLSPVYSLAVHNQGLWLLSGLESGGINLQSVRHDEGKRITCLRKHTSAVSVLTLAQDEKSVLSGSWDKSIHDWDLNTGDVKRSFTGSGGQISTIEARPLSSLAVPEESGTITSTNGTFSSNNATRPAANGFLPNGTSVSDRNSTKGANENDDAAGSPEDSLFGDKDSLFEDENHGPTGAPSGAAFGDDEDDEFSRAIANEIQQQQNEDAIEQEDVDMPDAGGAVQPPGALQESQPSGAARVDVAGEEPSTQGLMVNGLLHGESGSTETTSTDKASSTTDPIPSSESTFLDASFDGMIRVWDRRQPNAIARIPPSRSTPPWCLNACWSPDGNFIYAGRRNGTVDEYSLHKGLHEPRRTFRFPSGSGSVSAIKAMPSGKHLVCASYDILRLYDLKEPENTRHSVVPFLIVPGHRTGIISQLFIDPTCTFMISTAGNRGWEGATTEVLLGYEISFAQ